MGEVLDTDSRERRAEGMLRLSQRGHHHLVEQGGVGVWLSIDLLSCPGCPHNIVGGDAAN